MNDYCIRCAWPDVPGLYALAVALGVLAPLDDGTYAIAPPYTGGWDVIGEIHRATGEVIDDVPVTAPICDASGAPYWHANLRINASLYELAQASADPAVQAGLADLARWFVVGADGLATLPAQPARVWL